MLKLNGGGSLFSSGVQIAQGQKLTWDGSTGAKYSSSDGTTLTLTGLNFLAPNVEVPQAGKVTFDGATGAKYFSSDGTTLTLTGLNLLAPNVEVPQAGKVTFDGATGAKYLSSDGTTLTLTGLAASIGTLTATGPLQTTQAQKLTFDGATGAKYLSSDGTTLTLTGLNLLAPNVHVPTNGKLTFDGVTASKYMTYNASQLIISGLAFQIDSGNSITWNSGSVGFAALGASTGVYLNSAGGSAGSAQPGLGGTLYKGITPGNNGTTVETTLDSYSLPGSTLNANGRSIRITAWGTFAANANTKTVRLKFGATDLTGGAFTGTINANGWKVSAVVVRTGAATQTALCDWGAKTGSVSIQGNVTAPTETLSGAITVALTGQSGTASNDITSACLLIEFLN